MKIVQFYQCEICGTLHRNQAVAEWCEAHILEECPLKIGDNVKVYARYGEPNDDVVAGVSIGPAWFTEELSRIDDYNEYPQSVFDETPSHTWIIETLDVHQLGKDWFTNKVPIEQIVSIT